MASLPPNSPGRLLGLGLGPDPANLRATVMGKAAGAGRGKQDSGPVRIHFAGRVPGLEVDWHRRREHLLDDLRAIVYGPWPKLPKRLRFHDPWRPRRYFAVWFSCAALAHVVMIALPLPFWLAEFRPADLRQPREVQLTWSGPVKDLPALGPRSSAPKSVEPRREPQPAPAPAPAAADPAPPRIERAARQTIMATPAQPNHPRQLLIQPAAAPEPPKILPPLPNIVEFGATAQPARPRVSVSRETLRRLLPKAARRRTNIEAAAPALPNQELHIAPISIASNVPTVERPRMMLPAASAPATIQQRDVGETAAPDLGQMAPGGNFGESGRGIIALSNDPAPAPPSLDVPLGNLSARVAVSPLGPTPGPDSGTLGSTGKNVAGGNGAGPGGSGASGSNGSGPGGGNGGPTDIFISRGDPNKTSNISGPGGGSGGGSGSGLAPPRGSPGANPPRISSRDLALGSGRGGVTLPPADSTPLGGYAPTRPEEAVLRQKRTYTVSVNMPNLTSVTGSWVLRFAELDAEGNKTGRAPGGELSSPEAIRKVDPKYPPALVEARIEGDVVLYAIIRKDGTVDSVQVLRSLEPELDRNAMSAFTRWQFWPAIKAGTPVDIEAVVTIPFRAFAPKP